MKTSVIFIVLLCTVLFVQSVTIPPLAIQMLKMMTTGDVLVPGDAGYDDAVKIDNAYYDKNPQVVVQPKTVLDITTTILFAKLFNAKFSVKGGGHSAAGYCLNNDIVVHMKHFRTAQMVGPNVALIGAGLTSQEVYNLLHPNYPIGGLCGGVGMIGFTLGGGISVLSRKFGLAVDNLLEVRMVDAHGIYRIVNQQTDPELFWALRGGGGGNFGVVTEIKVKTHYLPTVVLSDICFPMERASEVIALYNDQLYDNIPNDLIIYGRWVLATQRLCSLTVWLGDDYNEGMQLLQPVLDLNPISPTFFNISLAAFINMMGNATSVGGKKSYIKAGMIKKGGFTSEVVEIVERYLENRVTDDCVIVWSHFGGKIAEVPLNATAFYRRNYQYVFEVKAVWSDPADEAPSIQWVTDFMSEMAPHIEGSYVNYVDPALSNWQEAYYGTNYAKLQKVKKRVDPLNFFNFAQSIEPN